MAVVSERLAPPGRAFGSETRLFLVKTLPPFLKGAPLDAAGAQLQRPGAPLDGAGAEFQRPGAPLLATGAPLDGAGAQLHQPGVPPILSGGAPTAQSRAPEARSGGPESQGEDGVIQASVQ